MSLHLHLEPIGGLAGDMFAAAMLDCFPDLWAALQDDLQAAGLLEEVEVDLAPVQVNGFAARRFRVETRKTDPNPTRHYAAIKARLTASALSPAVLTHALSIFDHLAEAEGRVHGCAPEEVHFHEVADWDSLADIVTAASLIERSAVASWSCGSLPMGRGTVRSAHGPLPLPAPAVVYLLQGFALHDDGLTGERVTPTGAAILRHLQPSNEGLRPSGRMQRRGAGAGKKRFPGLANLLHAAVIEVAPEQSLGSDRIARLTFEIDDMSPEALSIGLEHLRQAEGVLDVSYQTRFGKKGRSQFSVQVLAQPEQAEMVAELCFLETSTLGLRVDLDTRLILRREAQTLQLDSNRFAVKRAERPDGTTTAKVEAEALAEHARHHHREELAAEVLARGKPDD